MDQSKVREIVFAHAEELVEAFGLRGWTLRFEFDTSGNDGDSVESGSCVRWIDYQLATIKINSAAYDDGDEAAVLRTLRHELFHVVEASNLVFFQTVMAIHDGDAKVVAMLESIKSHVSERNVMALEQMYQGVMEMGIRKGREMAARDAEKDAEKDAARVQPEAESTTPVVPTEPPYRKRPPLRPARKRK